MIKNSQKKLITGPKPIPAKERFLKYYTIDTHGCWIWTGDKTPDGYGRFLLQCKRDGGEIRTSAHRASYVLHRGKIPNGLIVCHACDVKLCVNPDHLFVGTYKDNVDDMDRKGRRVKISMPGEKNPSAKLGNSTIEKIRLEYKNKNVSQDYLAKKFSISQSHVSRIVRCESWNRRN